MTTKIRRNHTKELKNIVVKCGFEKNNKNSDHDCYYAESVSGKLFKIVFEKYIVRIFIKYPGRWIELIMSPASKITAERLTEFIEYKLKS